MAGIYVHIPFCRSRCIYCDFYSTTREVEIPRYVEALCHEIEGRRNELKDARVRTIYIGGGTPSLLSMEQLQRILDCIATNYVVEAEAEVTVEMNPDDWPLSISPRGEDSLSSGKKNDNISLAAPSPTRGTESVAVNRISLGIQSFDDGLLRFIRRRHDAQTAIRTVRRLQEAGISNISIDLIYGLPGQTMAQWEHDLDVALSLDIQHLSAYALSYEEGTQLARWRREGKVEETPEEMSVAMYERLCLRAEAAGFEHYEISNFALPGYRSRHNSSYWTGEPYLGFGPGAHSYDGERTRRANRPALDEYVVKLKDTSEGGNMQKNDNVLKKLSMFQSFNLSTFETLSDSDLYDEAVMCGLRTCQGVDVESIAARFGTMRSEYLLAAATPHLQAGRLVLADGCLRLTRQALMTSDDVMSDLMAAETEN